MIQFSSPCKDPSLLGVVGKQKEPCLLFSVSYTGIQLAGDTTRIHISMPFLLVLSPIEVMPHMDATMEYYILCLFHQRKRN